MNPLILLPRFRKELDRKGVEFVSVEIGSIGEARRISKSKVIVNASGVGVRKLAGDEAVRPVRGQTMFVKTDFSELVMREESEYTYVIPRMGFGGVIMGGIKSDRLDAEVDVGAADRYFEEGESTHKRRFQRFEFGVCFGYRWLQTW